MILYSIIGLKINKINIIFFRMIVWKISTTNYGKILLYLRADPDNLL